MSSPFLGPRLRKVWTDRLCPFAFPMEDRWITGTVNCNRSRTRDMRAQ